jgi:hypothetical protein
MEKPETRETMGTRHRTKTKKAKKNIIVMNDRNRFVGYVLFIKVDAFAVEFS